MPDDNDNLMDPDEIESLLNRGGDPSKGLLSGNEIDALLQQQDLGDAFGHPPAGLSGPDDLLNRAPAGVAAAVAPEMPQRVRADPFMDAQPFQFEPLAESGGEAGKVALDALQEVELDLRIELGRTELLIEEVLKLREGSVVPLDKLAGDPVDILVNGRLIARGEVLVMNDNFCVRVAEILAPSLA